MKRYFLLLAVLALILSACAPPPQGAGAPVVDPAQLAPAPVALTTDTAGQAPGLGRSTQNLSDANITKTYVIDSQRWGDIGWTLDLPMSRYNYYREKTRPVVYFDYAKMSADPQDDDIIEAIIRNVRDTAAVKGMDRKDMLGLVLSFVQSIGYSEDIASTYRNEYPRSPVETLFERQGDCEDTSILAAAILTRMDFDVSLLLFEKFDHMGVGVNDPLIEYGNSWIFDSKRYWYFDTTGGRSVGWTPDEYAKTAAYVLPVTNLP